MGFSFSATFFADKPAAEILGSLETFDKLNAARLKGSKFAADLKIFGNPVYIDIDIFQCPHHWVIVEGGDFSEEWIREKNLFISQQTSCAGLYVFSHDGDYWGYELFDKGIVTDHFTSDASYEWYFKGENCNGNVNLLVKSLPFLDKSTIEPYLVRLPDFEVVSSEERSRLYDKDNIYPCPGDEYTRYAECSSINFLRAIGIDVQSPVTHHGFLGFFGWSRPMKFKAKLIKRIDVQV